MAEHLKVQGQKAKRNGGANKCEDDEGPVCVLSFGSVVLYDFLYAGNTNEQLTTITVSGLRENTHRENSFVGHVDYFNTLRNENNKHRPVISKIKE